MSDNNKVMRDLLETPINCDDRPDRIGDAIYYLADAVKYGDITDLSGPHYDTRR